MKDSCIDCKWFLEYIGENDDGEVGEFYECVFKGIEFDNYPDSSRCEDWEDKDI